jgi:hypothetical protein
MTRDDVSADARDSFNFHGGSGLVSRRTVPDACAMAGAATLYKARGTARRGEPCVICGAGSRGRTRAVALGFGVSVWLCAAHASDEFQQKRGGRDFVLTLQRLWNAHGCMTRRRSRALTAHIEALRGRAAQPRPGSYAWPSVRAEAEARFLAGEDPRAVIEDLRARHGDGAARPPSVRTMQRWFHERRWLSAAAAERAVTIINGVPVPRGSAQGGQSAVDSARPVDGGEMPIGGSSNRQLAEPPKPPDTAEKYRAPPRDR